MRHRPYPYAIVPKTPLRVGCGCILYCMENALYRLYRLYATAIHAPIIVPARPSGYTAYTAYTAIQLYTLYSIQPDTASLRAQPDLIFVYDSSDGRFWLRCVLVLPFPGCATHTVRRSRDAPRCTVRFGATDQMRTLMRVPTSSDAPRCTVQFGALDPRCTMVQVHGDPNEPSLGAGAAGAPCVTLAAISPPSLRF